MSSAINKTKSRLSLRLTRSFGGMFICVLVALSVIVFALAYGFLIQKQKDNLLTTAELISDHIVEELHEGEPLYGRGVMEEQNTNAYLNLYLFDTNGVVVNRVVNFHLDESMLASGEQAPTLRFSREHEMFLSSAGNIYDEGRFIGSLCAVAKMETEKDFLELLGLLLIGANIAGVFAALFVGWRTSRRMLAPIDGMISAARNIGEKSLNARLEVPEADDELKSLALTINDMLGRMESAFEAQGRFVADASHELRTPLAILQGNAELIERWGRQDEKVLLESINSIEKQTLYMNRLVDNLLYLARSDGNMQQLNKTVFCVKALFDELIEEQTLIDAERSYRCLCDDSLTLCADRSMIKQLLHALIDNSAKYTHAGGVITLLARMENKGVTLCVSDTGTGIGKEHLEHIFDRFYRVDKARARSTGGMGLGLSIAAAIVAAHSGRICAQSSPGLGTSIIAVFPA